MSDDRQPPDDDLDATRSVFDPEVVARRSERLGMPPEVDGYRILHVLGQGGMAMVYEAEQLEPRRRVAFKVMLAGSVMDDLHVRLFRREVETLARLRHPNIASIYGSGRLPDGRPYFAMELVEGETLGDYLSKRPSPSNRDELAHRLQIARRIAEAVHYAHQRGVIHRDLKPSNIFVTRGHDSGASLSGSRAFADIKILDFGLARLTDDDSGASLLSDADAIRGTLPYMSPEQARGESRSLDVRSDVYALGVVLYEMISGQRPYDVQRAALLEAIRVICEVPPRPMRDTPSGVTRVDADLETIVNKALEKDVDRRYASAAAFAEDLERFLTSQPILARAPSAAYQLRKLVDRHRALVGAAVIALVAVIAASVASTTMYFRARSEAAKASQVSRFLGEMLSGVGPGVARGRDTALLREVLETTAKRVGDELSGQPDVAAGIEYVLGNTYRELGDLPAARKWAASAYAKHRRLHSGAHPDVASDLSLLMRLAWAEDDLVVADSLATEVLAMRRRLASGPNDETASALTDLGSILLQRGEQAKAEPLLREALAMRKSLTKGGSRELAVQYNALGNAMQYRGEYAQAESLYDLALAMHTRVLGPLHPDVVVDLINLGNLKTNQNEFVAADSLLTLAIERGEKLYGHDHQDLEVAWRARASVRRRMGDFAGAAAAAQELLAMSQRLHGSDGVAQAAGWNELALIHNEWKGPAAGLPYAREALAVQRRLSPPGDIRLTDGMRNLGDSYAGLGMYAAAESLYAELMPIRRRVLGNDHPATLEGVNGYARLKLMSGELRESEKLFRESYEGRRRVEGEASAGTLVSMSDLATLLLSTGRAAEAESIWARARVLADSTIPEGQILPAMMHALHGRAMIELGRGREAEPEVRKATGEVAKLYGPENASTQDMTVDLARATGAKGNAGEADTLFRRAIRLSAADVTTRTFARIEYGRWLVTQRRHADAIAVLTAAEPDTRDLPARRMLRRARVLDALIEAHAGAGHAAEAAKWRAVRERERPLLEARLAR